MSFAPTATWAYRIPVAFDSCTDRLSSSVVWRTWLLRRNGSCALHACGLPQALHRSETGCDQNRTYNNRSENRINARPRTHTIARPAKLSQNIIGWVLRSTSARETIPD